MPLKIFAVLALCLAMTAPGLTATVVDMQLIGAAFFSDACRQQAEALGIARTPDANALVAAFAGLKRRPANSRAAERQQRDDCTVPAVELINLLRLNGIDAELVSATMANESVPADPIDRVLVYLPALDAISILRYRSKSKASSICSFASGQSANTFSAPRSPAVGAMLAPVPACTCTRRQATQRRPSASKPKRSAAAERRRCRPRESGNPRSPASGIWGPHNGVPRHASVAGCPARATAGNVMPRRWVTAPSPRLRRALAPNPPYAGWRSTLPCQHPSSSSTTHRALSSSPSMTGPSASPAS